MAIIYEQDVLNSIIHDSVSFKGAQVLDVGCGDGEDTLSYAASTEMTIGIDADGDRIDTAQQNTPESLRNRIQFVAASIEDFIPPIPAHRFDIVYFGWSL